MPRKGHGPEDLAVLQQAFDSVWKMLYAHVPISDEPTTRELTAALNHTLLGLAATGITDTRELTRKAAEHMLLTRH